MIAVMKEQRKRIHPHKFTLWIGLASIVMMFTGLTSAYIVKRNLSDWITFDLPKIFWYSTAVIIISSGTIMASRNSFKQRHMMQYRSWLLITLLLGIAFVVMQYVGFTQLWHNGVTLTRNVAFSFLYIIVGLHALHLIGGIIALIISLAKAYSRRVKNYDIVPVDIVNTYWHFVDLLWIYLFVFLSLIR
ncbi:MAG TPA: cytochrome c oxidase subunit 3 [Chitinophagaceae bacterium]|nr:cytochrome c oxidase subunit 3 [Chitinophagaceae bacterium]